MLRRFDAAGISSLELIVYIERLRISLAYKVAII